MTLCIASYLLKGGEDPDFYVVFIVTIPVFIVLIAFTLYLGYDHKLYLFLSVIGSGRDRIV